MLSFIRRDLIRKELWGFVITTICLFSLLAACSSLQTPVITDQSKQKQTVRIQADSFKFAPNNLVTYQGDVIVFSIESISDSTHNFSLEDPGGKVLQNVNLPARKTVEVEVTFSELGTYKFYCDKPLHSTLGMNGQISVITRKDK